MELGSVLFQKDFAFRWFHQVPVPAPVVAQLMTQMKRPVLLIQMASCLSHHYSRSPWTQRDRCHLENCQMPISGEEAHFQKRWYQIQWL